MSLTSEEKQQKLDELNEFIAQHKHDKGALMPRNAEGSGPLWLSVS